MLALVATSLASSVSADGDVPVSSALPPLVLPGDPASAPSYANRRESAGRGISPYLELQSGVQGVRHERLNVFAPFGSIRLGAWVYPGVGVEVFGDTPFAYGADNDFEAGVAEARGAALRLQSPPTDDIAGFITLGYVDFTVHQEPEAGGRELDERFTGAQLGIGLMQRLEILPALLFTAEYRYYYSDEPVQVDSLSLGFRLDVR